MRFFIVIINIFFTKKRKRKCSTDLRMLSRAVDATGISKSTVWNIIRQGEDFSTPGKNRKGGRKVRQMDGFDTAALRRIVHSFFREKKLPTVAMSLQEARKRINLEGSKSTLSRTLQKISFEYRVRT